MLHMLGKRFLWANILLLKLFFLHFFALSVTSFHHRLSRLLRPVNHGTDHRNTEYHSHDAKICEAWQGARALESSFVFKESLKKNKCLLMALSKDYAV